MSLGPPETAVTQAAAALLDQETPLTQLSYEMLLARVARARLYLIDLIAVDGASAPTAMQERDHLAYLYKLGVEGRLYGSGPADTELHVQPPEMAIVAAASLAEARRIAAAEPLVVAGLRRASVRAHIMNEGVACYVGRALHKRAEARGETFTPDYSDVTLSLQGLKTRAAGVSLFLIRLDSTDKPRPAQDTATRIEHFVWLRDNEMAARLMSCGPVLSVPPDSPSTWVSGLGIVATSRSEAERLASIEPSGRMGYRRLSVHSWRLDYGIAASIGTALVSLNQL